MPRYSDDEDEGDRREERKSADRDDRGRSTVAVRESADYGSLSKNEEARRLLRWTSFAKPKKILGFDLLAPAYVPSMSTKTKGYSIGFERVLGFPIPSSILMDVDQGDYDIDVQLSLSLFHHGSVSFFGSTWMGHPIPLTTGSKSLPREVDFDCNDLVYFMSRINDPSCVGVVEIVVSKKDIGSDVVAATYGCGWTMINCFAQQPPPSDIAEGHENVTVIVSVQNSMKILYPCVITTFPICFHSRYLLELILTHLSPLLTQTILNSLNK
jgi:hypothetical protein